MALLPMALLLVGGAPRMQGMQTRGNGHLVCMKHATSAKKGFGAAASKTKGGKKRSVVPLDDSVKAALAALEADADLPDGIERYLNPALFEDPATMEGISATLQSGGVAIVRDAFRPEFAEMVHAELSAKDVPWELNEAYFDDGYHHKHHNCYDKGLWSARMNMTLGVFTHAASKDFVGTLSARDCGGETTGAPSWYKAGEHSLPHTDWVGQRTVSYVWHLSKNWKPQWGGALYWAQNDHAVATYPASFNTLALFSVTTKSAHFVTTVSPHHKGKRLTFNGWWQSGWEPSLDDDLEGAMSDETRRSAITHTQLQAITDMLNDPWQNIPAERKEKLDGLRKQLMADFFPSGARAGLEA